MKTFIPQRIFTSEGWQAILNTVTNREIAFTVWIVVLFIWAFYKSPDHGANLVSNSIRLIKIPFGKALRSITLFFLLGTLISIITIRAIGYWDLLLLKQTLFWFFSVALLFYYHLNDANNFGFFKKMATQAISITIILPFFLHFFTFNLITEFIIAPIQIFFVIAVAYFGVYNEKENDSAKKLSSVILSILGFIYIAYAGYMILSKPGEVFSKHAFKELLLSSFLTLLFLPFAYLSALWLSYASVFHCLNSTTKRLDTWPLKRAVIFRCRFNLERTVHVQKGINYFEIPTLDKIISLTSNK